MREQTGFDHDESFPPKLVGTYNQPKARGKRINDRYNWYVVRAKSLHCKADGAEIKAGALRWFAVAYLRQMLVDTYGKEVVDGEELPAQALAHDKAQGLSYEGERYFELVPWMLESYARGRFLRQAPRQQSSHEAKNLYYL